MSSTNKPQKKSKQRGKKMDTSRCPKKGCGAQHPEPFPARPTLCSKCQSERKANSNKKSSTQNQNTQREPNRDPYASFADLKRQKKIRPGDVIVVSEKGGWFFVPADLGSNSIAESVCTHFPEGINALLDWGGVFALIGQLPNRKYIKKPKLITLDGTKVVYSYTPTNKCKDLPDMWETAKAANLTGMIITTQKGVNAKGKATNEIGKHQLLAPLLVRILHDCPKILKVSYYEDTGVIFTWLLKLLSAKCSEQDLKKIDLAWVMPTEAEFRKQSPEKNVAEEDRKTRWIDQKEFLIEVTKN